MKTIVALFCVVGLTSTLQAQTEAPAGGPPPLPPGPLIQTRAPDFAEWVITKKAGSLDDTESNSTPAPAVPGAKPPPSTQDTVTKTTDVYRIVHLDAAQRPWTIWGHGANEYMIWPDGKSCAGVNPSFGVDFPNPFYYDFSASDFSGFEWISRQNYTGIKSYQGIKCIVFQSPSKTPPANGPGDSKQTAYINFATRLPVALQSGGDISLYKWNPPPAGTLSFPEVVQALINSNVKRQGPVSQRAAPF